MIDKYINNNKFEQGYLYVNNMKVTLLLNRIDIVQGGCFILTINS